MEYMNACSSEGKFLPQRERSASEGQQDTGEHGRQPAGEIRVARKEITKYKTGLPAENPLKKM